MSNQYHTIKDGKIYLLPTLGQPEREIGDVKNSEEETVSYFSNRFSLLKSKIEELKKNIEEANNKGSFMMKLLHLKESIKTYNGIGDFEGLLNDLNETETLLSAGIEQNRAKNATIKNGIIDQAKELAASDNWTEDIEKIKELQSHWNKTGKAAEELETELQKNFKDTVGTFFNKSVEQLDALQKELVSVRVQQYEFLIAEAKKLLQGNLKENANAFKELQTKWRELSEIPSNLYEKLIIEFKELGNSFFTQLKSKSKPSKQKYKPQVDPKEAWEKISQQAETLFTMKNIHEAVTLAKKLQTELKELKYTSRKKGFRGEGKLRAACEYVFEKQYLEKKVKERVDNFDQLSDAAQRKEKINFLRFIIKKGEEEINQMEQNKDKMVFGENNQDFARIFDSRLSSYSRKLKAKTRILDELKAIT